MIISVRQNIMVRQMLLCSAFLLIAVGSSPSDIPTLSRTADPSVTEQLIREDSERIDEFGKYLIKNYELRKVKND